MSNGIWGLFHLIGHIFMIQMDSFISGFDSGSRAHFPPKTFQRFIYLLKFNTLSTCPEIVSVIGIWGLIHLIGHIFMMQMDSFNFGF